VYNDGNGKVAIGTSKKIHMETVRLFSKYGRVYIIVPCTIIAFLCVCAGSYCATETGADTEGSSAIMKKVEELEKLNEEAEALMDNGEYKKANEIYSTILEELRDPSLRAYIEKEKYAHEKSTEIEKAVADAKAMRKKRERERAKAIGRRRNKTSKEKTAKEAEQKKRRLSPGEKRARRREIAFQKELDYYLTGTDYIKEIMERADYLYERGEFIEAEKLYEKARELCRQRVEGE